MNLATRHIEGQPIRCYGYLLKMFLLTVNPHAKIGSEVNGGTSEM